MAIRPVDLQLAYLSAPQNAGQVSAAQAAPEAAQQAAQATFAAQVREREEQIAGAQKAEGNIVRPRGDRDPNEGREHAGGRQGHKTPYDRPAEPGALGLAGDGEHFIDVTA